MRVGLISDTHGLMRPQALEALAGAQLIVHAGDIGDADILARLRDIAPVHAVRGNNDHGDWADALPLSLRLFEDRCPLLLLHDLHELSPQAAADGTRVVVSGHSHRPRIDVRDGILYVNPGSAGPRRFRLPVSVAWLELGTAGPVATIVPLSV